MTSHIFRITSANNMRSIRWGSGLWSTNPITSWRGIWIFGFWFMSPITRRTGNWIRAILNNHWGRTSASAGTRIPPNPFATANAKCLSASGAEWPSRTLRTQEWAGWKEACPWETNPWKNTIFGMKALGVFASQRGAACTLDLFPRT